MGEKKEVEEEIYKYRIKYNYDTGDTFSTQEGCEDYLEGWNNLDIAKENLKRIEEHYTYYRKINTGYHKDYNKIIKSMSNERWGVKDNINVENCIMLLADNGVEYRIWCPWCGYFESLNYAEIEEIKNNSGMKIEF